MKLSGRFRLMSSVIIVVQLGCGGGGDRAAASASARASAAAPAASSNTILIGPNGVTGPPLVGEPSACASFHACCDEAEKKGAEGLGLTCGLAHAASNGQCEEALRLVRSIIAEQKQTAPPGCL